MINVQIFYSKNSQRSPRCSLTELFLVSVGLKEVRRSSFQTRKDETHRVVSFRGPGPVQMSTLSLKHWMNFYRHFWNRLIALLLLIKPDWMRWKQIMPSCLDSCFLKPVRVICAGPKLTSTHIKYVNLTEKHFAIQLPFKAIELFVSFSSAEYSLLFCCSSWKMEAKISRWEVSSQRSTSVEWTAGWVTLTHDTQPPSPATSSKL